MTPISAASFIALPRQPDVGAAPMLQWIPIANLGVDPSYQREIRQQGRKNVRKIAEEFSWSKFATVIVSPVAGGLFAIVDGQHRVTAALLANIESVPCQVIIATPSEQAAAFHAINGTVTKMTTLQLHAAAVAAGHPDALRLKDICGKIGVELLRHTPSAQDMKPGQTRCVDTISKCIRIFGEESVIAALGCITRTANRETAGILQATVIRALCDLIKQCPELIKSGEALFEAFDDIDIEEQLDASRTQRKARGETTATVLTRRLLSRLGKTKQLASVLKDRAAA
jgi:ParB-like nuclease domain